RDVAEALNLPMATVSQGAARLWHDHGPVPLVLAIAAPLFAPRRAVVYYTLAVAAFCSLAPLRLVYRLPGYGGVRFGVEWWFVTPFALHLVSALGVSSWRDRFHARIATALIAASLLIAGATLWNWRAADVGHMLVRSVRPPAVPVSSLADCVGPSRAVRVFWPGADAQGVPLDARLTSVVGYEPSMRPARMMTLLARLGLETSAWAANLAAHPTVAARLALRCVQTPRRQPELERAGWDVVP